ncbi:hypothetical protein [Streptomyces sp. NBC_00829]|uniref:hypothetical protein n=1 Tax=Streptomyces sp. NBC_00829 TaxID=2903679 RepID=UPI0038703A31|nr:hypothetical protein OG293_25210 [Streptomyces sp. NBC_00829]
MGISRAVVATVLSLGCTVGTAGPASADGTLPYAPGKVLSVRPGDVLTATAPAFQNDLGSGDVLTSTAFLNDGVLRMHTPRLTATVAIKCDATPGIHTVKTPPFPSWARHGTFTQVRVEKADAAAASACRSKLKNLPPDSKEEQWPKETDWPATDWDVRVFPAGSKVEAHSTLHSFDGPLVSPAFADRPVMHESKSEEWATVTIKCDAKPGLYPVYEQDEDAPDVKQKVWARYRVAPADESTRRSCTAGKPALAGANSSTKLVTWTAASGATLAAVAGALLIIRRRRSRA